MASVAYPWPWFRGLNAYPIHTSVGSGDAGWNCSAMGEPSPTLSLIGRARTGNRSRSN